MAREMMMVMIIMEGTGRCFFVCNFRFILLLFFAFTCLDFSFKVLINEIGNKIGCQRRPLYRTFFCNVLLEVSLYLFPLSLYHTLFCSVLLEVSLSLFPLSLYHTLFCSVLLEVSLSLSLSLCITLCFAVSY